MGLVPVFIHPPLLARRVMSSLRRGNSWMDGAGRVKHKRDPLCPPRTVFTGVQHQARPTQLQDCAVANGA